MKRNLKNLVMDARQISAVCGRARTAGRAHLQSKGEAEPWKATLGSLKTGEESKAERQSFKIGKGGMKRVRKMLRSYAPERQVCSCKGKDGALKNIYATRAEAERQATYRSSLIGIPLFVLECLEGKGFHLTKIPQA